MKKLVKSVRLGIIFTVNEILLDEQAIDNIGEVSALGDGTGRWHCILDFSDFYKNPKE